MSSVLTDIPVVWPCVLSGPSVSSYLVFQSGSIDRSGSRNKSRQLALVLPHWSLTSSLGLGKNWHTGMTSITSPSNPSNARRNDILLMFEEEQSLYILLPLSYTLA